MKTRERLPVGLTSFDLHAVTGEKQGTRIYNRIPPRIGFPATFFLWVRLAVAVKSFFDLERFILWRFIGYYSGWVGVDTVYVSTGLLTTRNTIVRVVLSRRIEDKGN